MDWKALQVIVPDLPVSKLKEIAPRLNAFLITADCTTLRRAQYAVANLAEESAGFKRTEEYADGSAYEWRLDLGNTHQGDGHRFRGSTWIMTTGRTNFGRVSLMAFLHGIVKTKTWFVDHPDDLRLDKYAELGPEVYWADQHNHGYIYLNKAADAGDFITYVKMINGGTNGLDIRQTYLRRAQSLGDRILPTKKVEEPNMLEAAALIRGILLGGKYATAKLRAKYPRLVREEGLVTRMNRHGSMLTNHESRLDKLEAALKNKADKPKATK